MIIFGFILWTVLSVISLYHEAPYTAICCCLAACVYLLYAASLDIGTEE